MAAKPRYKPTGPRIGGLPTYTREQFREVRPQGNYQNYLNFIKRRRGITTGPAYPGRGGPGLPTYMSLLKGLRGMNETPAQLEARANRMAQTQMKYQRDMLAEDYKRSQDDAMRRMLAFQSAGRAAAAMNASLIGQVGAGYQQGADALSNMSAAGAQQMAAGTQAAVDSANAAAANVGMPAVGEGGSVGTPGVAGPGQANIENYRGGVLGAQQLENAGGFAQAGAAGQIGMQNLRATQEAQAAYMSAMEQANTAKASAMRELVAGRPGVAAEYLKQLQDAQRQQIALAMSLIGARRGALQAGQKHRLDESQVTGTYKGKPTIQAVETQAQIQAANAKLQQAAAKQQIEWNRIDSAASRAAGYLIDKAGRPIKGKNGQLIPVATSSGGKGGTGLTPYQMTRAYEKANNLADVLFYGYKTDKNGKRIPANQAGDFDPDNSATYGTGRATYANAVGRLQQLGIPKAQAQAMLNQLYERGDQGRPLFSTVEKKHTMTVLAKKYGQKTANGLWGRAQKWINYLLDEERYDDADRWIAQLLNGTIQNPLPIPPGR